MRASRGKKLWKLKQNSLKMADYCNNNDPKKKKAEKKITELRKKSLDGRKKSQRRNLNGIWFVIIVDAPESEINVTRMSNVLTATLFICYLFRDISFRNDVCDWSIDKLAFAGHQSRWCNEGHSNKTNQIKHTEAKCKSNLIYVKRRRLTEMYANGFSHSKHYGNGLKTILFSWLHNINPQLEMATETTGKRFASTKI